MAARPLCVSCRQRPADARWRPFCSQRCKMADLGRWLNEHYRVADATDPAGEHPAGEPDEENDDDDAARS